MPASLEPQDGQNDGRQALAKLGIGRRRGLLWLTNTRLHRLCLTKCGFMRHKGPCRAPVSLKMRPSLRQCSVGQERPRWRPGGRLRGGFPLKALGLAPRAKYVWP
jgi:hypothetical protein